MQKKFQYIVFVLVCLLMVSCGKKEATKDTQEKEKTKVEKQKEDPKNKIKIGVEIYDPYETEFVAIKEYFTNIEENYNIEFLYSDAIMDRNQEIDFIDYCKDSNCKGFISYYNLTGMDQVDKVIQHKMFYIDNGMDPSIFEKYKDDKYYLGTMDKKNFYYESGVLLAKWVLEEDFKTIIYAGGDLEAEDKKYTFMKEGFTNTIKEKDVKVISFDGFPDESYFKKQAKILRKESIDAVCATYGEPDLWSEPMIGAGLEGIAKFSIVNTLNNTMKDSFKTGEVNGLITENIAEYGKYIALICNAVGEKEDDTIKLDNKPLFVDEKNYEKEFKDFYDKNKNMEQLKNLAK